MFSLRHLATQFGGFRRTSAGLNRRAVVFAPLAVVCWLNLPPSITALIAAETFTQESDLFALREYVGKLDHASDAVNGRHDTSADVARLESAYTALRSYVESIEPSSGGSLGGPTKLAEADNAVDALREFFQKGATPKSSDPPPVPSRRRDQRAQPSTPIVATSVGSKVCSTCHANETTQFNHTLMGRLAKTQKGKFECESCHGPGSAHVNAGGGRGVGGLITYRPDDQSRTVEESNAICLGCHERGDRTYWNGSTHETRGLMCSSCHTVMKQVSRKFQLKTAFEPDTCFQCHKDRRAENYFSSHMATRQGKITCSNCHNSHGSATEAMLRENSVNDNCYKCHAEKRGPFLWEHNPVRENCLNCHEAHGSTKQALLKVQGPKLCAECHGFNHGATNPLGPTNSRFVFNKGCSNCHSKVHGSNHPSGMFFLR
jgi:DmsE family decaheme c-type cytochrome